MALPALAPAALAALKASGPAAKALGPAVAIGATAWATILQERGKKEQARYAAVVALAGAGVGVAGHVASVFREHYKTERARLKTERARWKHQERRSEMNFQIYTDSAGEWRWRFRADNNEIIAVSSEGYVRKSSCQHSIDLVKQGAADADVEDEDE